MIVLGINYNKKVSPQLLELEINGKRFDPNLDLNFVWYPIFESAPSTSNFGFVEVAKLRSRSDFFQGWKWFQLSRDILCFEKYDFRLFKGKFFDKTSLYTNETRQDNLYKKVKFIRSVTPLESMFVFYLIL